MNRTNLRPTERSVDVMETETEKLVAVDKPGALRKEKSARDQERPRSGSKKRAGGHGRSAKPQQPTVDLPIRAPRKRAKSKAEESVVTPKRRAKSKAEQSVTVPKRKAKPNSEQSVLAPREKAKRSRRPSRAKAVNVTVPQLFSARVAQRQLALSGQDSPTSYVAAMTKSDLELCKCWGPFDVSEALPLKRSPSQCELAMQLEAQHQHQHQQALEFVHHCLEAPNDVSCMQAMSTVATLPILESCLSACLVEKRHLETSDEHGNIVLIQLQELMEHFREKGLVGPPRGSPLLHIPSVPLPSVPVAGTVAASDWESDNAMDGKDRVSVPNNGTTPSAEGTEGGAASVAQDGKRSSFASDLAKISGERCMEEESTSTQQRVLMSKIQDEEALRWIKFYKEELDVVDEVGRPDNQDVFIKLLQKFSNACLFGLPLDECPTFAAGIAKDNITLEAAQESPNLGAAPGSVEQSNQPVIEAERTPLDEITWLPHDVAEEFVPSHSVVDLDYSFLLFDYVTGESH